MKLKIFSRFDEDVIIDHLLYKLKLNSKLNLLKLILMIMRRPILDFFVEVEYAVVYLLIRLKI